ncbi:hypothetical protein A3F00_03530 [Candidatus Daviesbacteria bacterium RIFCSPHIGHO2_12_FULL_37_11]|uniref:FemAB family protein n=1 Tax=Candidatus Daviesbacteria bacterium RIFCSPHIGHO2_12_FULL_37_11 TaxID=1797777 RepID=A0A1F5KCN9_9BACT|nr:MAG: hypothetical protein A2769_01110 [Candidatus Daviesbacteria bacterium RIFCSPHIGHO2_01_FULL_37_27]OGE38713.1 MAG: hypothetical protein A3F00_03530 [Candidatus Daviesbacteria bacterium RIFCSPHIGHO2_12_FULL_37_11]OGE45803.1 MAG: hypothetical protein A3B39_01070 [Candidatus Daviesbacteria bacterium RIFCSPLOWO2_01_FULL_37_10]
MDLRKISDNQKSEYNKLVTHVMQSWEWGEFRKNMGLKVLRYGLYDGEKIFKAFQLTIHHIPFTNLNVGYLPKGSVPDEELAEALIKIGHDQNCAFIKVEPNIEMESGKWKVENYNSQFSILNSQFIPSPKPLFTKHNFIIDLTKSEEELLKNMHPKTRYNIKVAQKHGVKVEERTDDEAFELYLKLYFETTKRQGYHGHNENYHRKVWETLRNADMARFLIATYNEEPLTAWMLLNFQDTLYYPYGGSSKSHPEVMANNLVAWEAMKLGKKLGLKKFDMWGALGPDADPKDPWYGFHKFKQGYGGKLVEYIGTYDLVLNWPIYWMFTAIDKLLPVKVFLLKLLRR